jgi:hypothetical protein
MDCLGGFVLPPKQANICIEYFTSISSNARVGTIKWSITVDQQAHHVLKNPDHTYYIESCPVQLLLVSPQHHSQQINNH